jgi:hypothetical protein
MRRVISFEQGGPGRFVDGDSRPARPAAAAPV